MSLKPPHLALALTGLALAACGRDTANPSRPADAPALVRAAPVTDTVLARPVVATGSVAPEDEISLGFKIGGVIARISVDAGDRVRAGQILASLDLREIDAGLAKARSGAAKATRDLSRARRLYTDSVVTLAQLEDAETGDEVARADLQAASVNRRYAVIVAPASGVVLRRMAEAGENVAAGSPVLVLGSRGTGSHTGNKLKVGLADRDVVSIRRGDAAIVRFDALSGRTYAGRVSRIGAAADPATGTYEVEIALDRADGLAAGLVGRVEIRPSEGAPATLVPVEAVLEADGGDATVYALSSDGGHAMRRRVTVGFIDGNQVAISKGLENVTRVLTDGASYLDDGAAVRVQP
jgi:multidrug efflux system membrane fusion protein